MGSPGDIPPLRVFFNVPVLRALRTIDVDGVAVDFEGFSFFVYVAGEEETATRLPPCGQNTHCEHTLLT